MASSPTDGIGLSNLKHSRRQRALLDQINKLHSTGVHVDIDLPQISVIGSQSAGKSSLIEAISGITLPRASGTCTRCPTECRLTYSSKPWSCKVSLQLFRDASGQLLGESRNEAFGEPIKDKALVEDRIRRAQRALLNPKVPSQEFLSGNFDDTSNECSFSKNRVLLQISGPDVADLSFCDLPGLIASVSGGGDVGDIDLVKGLIEEYIEKPSCVILLTVACETDFENQGAHHLAKGHDKNGGRTVGVLTKPDRIPAGEEENWLRFIMNEREPLENNWFCVKQPSSQELSEGLTWVGARENETKFFLGRPWRDLDPVYKQYLGTSNLVGRLSTILSNLIESRLPQIQEEIDSAIRATEEELARLPKEPSQEPLREVQELLYRFVDDLKGEIDGRPHLEGLIQTFRPHQDAFRESIKRTAPHFVPFEESEDQRAIPAFTFLLTEETDEDADTSDDICVDEVMERASGARSRELPGHIPFSVQQFYINRFLEHWSEPAVKLCKAVNDILKGVIVRLVTKHFSTFGQGGLEHRVRLLMQDHLKTCYEHGMNQIRWLLELENLPFTANSSSFAFYQKKFLGHYQSARHAAAKYGKMTPKKKSYELSREEAVTQALAALAQLGISVSEEDLSKLSPGDQMDTGLTIMADVRAYFQVAYQRFADNIPMAIDRELVQGLGRDSFKTLSTGLGINGMNAQEICREWAREPLGTAAKRTEQKKKLERLQGARLELMQINH